VPILYEATPVVKLRKPRRFQVKEAPRWRVVQEYYVNSIYMTADQLTSAVRDQFYKAAREKNLKVESFGVLNAWAVWKVAYTEYHCVVEAYLAGSPLAQVVILAVLAIIELALIALIIYLVGTYIVQPIFAPAPPAPGWPALPTVAYAAIFIGLAAIPIGLTYYVIKRRKG